MEKNLLIMGIFLFNPHGETEDCIKGSISVSSHTDHKSSKRAEILNIQRQNENFPDTEKLFWMHATKDSESLEKGCK